MSKEGIALFLVGLLAAAGGGYLMYYFWNEFLQFFKGGIGLVLLLVGLLLLIIGAAEIKD